MKMKTSELSGKALDYAVALANNWFVEIDCGECWIESDGDYIGYLPSYSPSSNWSQGGPIIDRERIELIGFHKLDARKHGVIHQGKTSLISAMRCYVAGKMGDVIDVPATLC